MHTNRGLFIYFIGLIMIFCVDFTSGQKVGLVLSGGGARGLAHIGVIKALEENHIPIDFITGTSAGAIVGCMYALGYSARQMDSIVRSEDFLNWATGVLDEGYTYYFKKKEDNPSWITLKFSLDSVLQTTLPTFIVSSIPYDYALMEFTSSPIAKADYNFDSLFIPYRCVASDIENKRTVIFRNGDLAQAVRASSAYPFYFKPVNYQGKILYDGGMYNNFPVDIMLQDFQPDIVIGVNASGTNNPTSEDNIVSQIRAMMTTPTNFSVICENGILINVNSNKFGLFDFSRVGDIINEGYNAGKSQMERIKFNIQRRVDTDNLNRKRQNFRSSLKPVNVEHVVIEGVNSKQADYVRQIVKPFFAPIPLSRLKAHYFQLVADQNVKSVFPSLRYNPSTGNYDMKLVIKRERDLITQFGGNLSSRPVSEAFAGLEYNLWGRRAYSFTGNFYFGKLYTSGQLKIRMDSPSPFQYFLESDVTLNQYDFYRSSNAFFSEEKPSYILKSDYNFGLNFGIPARNKGKFVASTAFVRIGNDYYQTKDFLQSDTADKSIYTGMTGAITFERNSLNRKQYANVGTFFSMQVRYANLEEQTLPGSTSADRTEELNYHDWFTFKLIYDNYYKRRGHLKFGFYGNLVVSNMPFFNNYTTTVLNSPSFEPIQETQTLFLSNFHAHDFAGIGSRNVWMINNSIDIRLEGYCFVPYQELLKTNQSKTEYGPILNKRYYIASTGAIYHSPIGPIAVFLNYYQDRKNPLSFLFHIGYFIFNKSALD